jgi:hypothetical protein
VRSTRKYLSPDEARRVIDAAGRLGRLRERDKPLLMMMFRHGLRVSEAIDLRWTDFGLDAPRARPFYVRRIKGSKDSVHTLEPDTAKALKRMKDDADGIYVFRSERGGPLSPDIVEVICERGARGRSRFQSSSSSAAPRRRLCAGRSRDGYAVNPGFPRPQGHQEYRGLYKEDPGRLQGRAPGSLREGKEGQACLPEGRGDRLLAMVEGIRCPRRLRSRAE